MNLLPYLWLATTDRFKSRRRLIRERREAVELAQSAAAKYAAAQGELAQARDKIRELEREKAFLLQQRRTLNYDLTSARAEASRLRHREAIVRDTVTGRFVRDVA